jgi:hypothetical protein
MVNVYGLSIILGEDEEIPKPTPFPLQLIVILEGCLVWL